MASPAGPCEWCGGPQNWTIIAGDMYVRCIDGCLPLELEELVPPPPTSEEKAWWTSMGAGVGTLQRMGGVPCEGGDVETSPEGSEWPGDPPQAFLDSLWEGYDGQAIERP